MTQYLIDFPTIGGLDGFGYLANLGVKDDFLRSSNKRTSSEPTEINGSCSSGHDLGSDNFKVTTIGQTTINRLSFSLIGNHNVARPNLILLACCVGSDGIHYLFA